MRHSLYLRGCVFSGLAILAAASSARAAVSAITANVTSEVQELSGDTVLNSDRAFDDLDVTTYNLPLLAEARLLPPNSGQTIQQLNVAAEAVTKFFDPRLNTSDPPNEFSLSAIGFSNTQTSTVTGHALAVETREIVFQPDEVDLEAGTAVTARSHFFLDGVMALLAEAGPSGLAGDRAELTLRIIQQRSGADPLTVLEAAVVLTGNSDGSAGLNVNGAMTVGDLASFGLNGLAFSQGTFQAVALSNLSIPYTYSATVGETFELRAEVEANFEAPPGMGAVIVIGDRLNELTTVIENALGPDLAADFETGLSLGLNNARLQTKPIAASEQDTTLEVSGSGQNIPLLNGSRCGVLGMESVMMAAGLAVLGLTVRTRRASGI